MTRESNIKLLSCHGVILWWKCIFIGPSMVGAEETSDYHIYGIYAKLARSMMTSSNGNIFRFTGPLYGEFTSHRWIPPHNGTLMFSLICAWTNGWVNNQDAGDLRRHRDHYDVTVMTCGFLERTAIVTSNSIVEWNIFRVRVGLGAGWVDMYFIWYIILL